jgi:hypothetical protein
MIGIVGSCPYTPFTASDMNCGWAYQFRDQTADSKLVKVYNQDNLEFNDDLKDNSYVGDYEYKYCAVNTFGNIELCIVLSWTVEFNCALANHYWFVSGI